MMVTEKFKQILEACGDDDRLVGAPESIKIMESKIGKPLPSDLKEYFCVCIPKSSAGRWPVFEPIETVLDDLENHPVASHVLPMGFVSFANGRDGGQFAYGLDDGGIYELGVEVVDVKSLEEVKEVAANSWASLMIFLEWNLEQIKLG